MKKKSGLSSSGADGILHCQGSEHEGASSMEVVGSSWGDIGSARGLLPPRSVTRKGASLHSEENVANESLVIQGPTSSPLGRRRREISPATVSNSWQIRTPASKRQHWSNSWFTQLTVVTVLLVMAGLTANMCVSLDSPTYEATYGDAEQGFGGQDINGTGHNDTFFLSTVDSPAQTRLEETGVSQVRKIEVEGGRRLNSNFSVEQRVRPADTGRRLGTHSAHTTDGGSFMVKRKAASVPVAPVLSLLAANSKRKDYQPLRPHWLEPKETWMPYWGNRT